MAGGAPRPLVEDVVWASADWDPQVNGELAAVRRIGGANRLEFPIGKSLAFEDVYGGRFTPDGEEFVFWKGGADGFELQVIDRQGKGGSR